MEGISVCQMGSAYVFTIAIFRICERKIVNEIVFRTSIAPVCGFFLFSYSLLK